MVRDRINLDKLGAVAGTICAVHCVLTGLAFGLLSVVGLSFIGSNVAEVCFVGFTLLVGLLAIWHGVRQHHSLIPAGVFILGLIAIVAKQILHHHSEEAHEVEILPTALSVIGGTCIVLFHVVNQRMQRRCGHIHCDHHH